MTIFKKLRNLKGLQRRKIDDFKLPNVRAADLWAKGITIKIWVELYFTKMIENENEGKRLKLAAYLNSLNNGSVHIVTVNDYLAKDSEWMGI